MIMIIDHGFNTLEKTKEILKLRNRLQIIFTKTESFRQKHRKSLYCYIQIQHGKDCSLIAEKIRTFPKLSFWKYSNSRLMLTLRHRYYDDIPPGLSNIDFWCSNEHIQRQTPKLSILFNDIVKFCVINCYMLLVFLTFIIVSVSIEAKFNF